MTDLQERIKELEQENRELNQLFELQHTRVARADKLWQKAHNKPNVLPDLGVLVEWLLSQIPTKE